MNTPAMIIDFEATDVSKEAEATQLGYRNIRFHEDGYIVAEMMYSDIGDGIPSHTINCCPDRTISYGAMAVSHIMPDDVKDYRKHKVVVPQYLPVGEAYIIGHNVDFDIQVAANAGVDVSQYKRICTQALARKYCRNAHDAGYDVTFTLWLLEHLCELGGITNMQDLHNASEIARIPTAFTFGKYYGRKITEVAFENPGYLRWIIEKHDNTYLIEACKNVLASKGASHG